MAAGFIGRLAAGAAALGLAAIGLPAMGFAGMGFTGMGLAAIGFLFKVAAGPVGDGAAAGPVGEGVAAGPVGDGAAGAAVGAGAVGAAVCARALVAPSATIRQPAISFFMSVVLPCRSVDRPAQTAISTPLKRRPDVTTLSTGSSIGWHDPRDQSRPGRMRHRQAANVE